MHAIAMVHKMQRLALSSSSMIPVAIQEEEKEETTISDLIADGVTLTDNDIEVDGHIDDGNECDSEGDSAHRTTNDDTTNQHVLCNATTSTTSPSQQQEEELETNDTISSDTVVSIESQQQQQSIDNLVDAVESSTTNVSDAPDSTAMDFSPDPA